ncbi:hypothetical protein V5799_025034 [Amblyomma americanum]|uniref:Uncharacterized protein n=2 Tax=Amblyomma americanum TaxID=6943 RepID=A0AAQ4EAW4_AMBAM
MSLHQPPEFLPTPGKPAIPWTQWHRLFKNYLLASGSDAHPPARRKALLLHCLGVEGQRLYYALPEEKSSTPPTEGKEGSGTSDEYDAAVATLDAYFTSKTNVVVERHRFGQRTQLPGETATAFVTALRELALSCDFVTAASKVCLFAGYARIQDIDPDDGGRGYPVLFAQRTSALLSDARQTLHRTKDDQERRWLQVFVKRLAQLATDFEQSSHAARSRPVSSSAHMPLQHQQEQTAPTTGQISPPPSPALAHNSKTTTTESAKDDERSTGKPQAVTTSRPIDDGGDDLLTRQLREQRHRVRSPGVVRSPTTEAYSLDSGRRVSVWPTTPLAGEDASLIKGHR